MAGIFSLLVNLLTCYSEVEYDSGMHAYPYGRETLFFWAEFGIFCFSYVIRALQKNLRTERRAAEF